MKSFDRHCGRLVLPMQHANSQGSMRTLSCDMWDLVPQPGMQPGSPALGASSLSYWTTKEVPRLNF